MSAYIGLNNSRGALPNIKVDGEIAAISNVTGLATALAGKAKALVKAGSATTVDLGVTPASIVAILAFVTASGAPATKCLLAATTDYTLAGSVLTCVTNQSANTLLVIYT